LQIFILGKKVKSSPHPRRKATLQYVYSRFRGIIQQPIYPIVFFFHFRGPERGGVNVPAPALPTFKPSVAPRPTVLFHYVFVTTLLWPTQLLRRRSEGCAACYTGSFISPCTVHVQLQVLVFSHTTVRKRTVSLVFLCTGVLDMQVKVCTSGVYI